MDKAQKELITTYFRKREIAQKQSKRYGYTSHELIYLIENGVDVNLKRLDFTEITNILEKRPDLINKLDLSKLNGDYIGALLVAQPQLIKLINGFDLSKIDANDIHWLLKKHPQLIDAKGLNGSKLDLSKLDGYNISEILKAQPQLINRFDLSKIDANDIYWLLMKHPQLVDWFDLSEVGDIIVNTLEKSPQFVDWFDLIRLLEAQPQLINRLNIVNLDSKEINDILSSQPQLAKYFNR